MLRRGPALPLVREIAIQQGGVIVGMRVWLPHAVRFMTSSFLSPFQCGNCYGVMCSLFH